MRHVVRQRADGGGPRRGGGRLPFRQRRCVQSREQPGRGRLDVAFNARHLAREEHVRPAAHLPCLGEHGRSVHVRIAMDHSEPHELGLFESGHEPQDARLLAPLELRLEADQAVVIAREVVLAQLHGGVRLAAGARIDEADRLHRAEPQRVDPSMRHHFDRQAAFKKAFLVEIVNGGRLGMDERVVETIVLLVCERTVHIVALTVVHTTRRAVAVHRLVRRSFSGGGSFKRRRRPNRSQAAIPSRGAKDLGPIDGVSEHDGADRVVKVQVRPTDERLNGGGQGVRGERPRRHNHRLALARRRDRRNFLADDGDEPMVGEGARHLVGEPLAIDRERRAGRHAVRVGGPHDDRAEPPHFFFEEAHGVIELVAAERVAAHELGKPIGFVNSRGAYRPHFVQRHRHALRRRLPGGLGTSEAAADDLDHLFTLRWGPTPSACAFAAHAARLCHVGLSA